MHLFSRKRKLTALGSNFASGPASFNHSLVLARSITPSTTIWPTCTPCGPNSLAKLWLSARLPNLPVANVENCALPRTLAVAPVNSRVGGCSGLLETALRRPGRRSCEKITAPLLESVLVRQREMREWNDEHVDVETLCVG
jgi:hypothetical protein